LASARVARSLSPGGGLRLRHVEHLGLPDCYVGQASSEGVQFVGGWGIRL
jgi:hypothetical protein